MDSPTAQRPVRRASRQRSEVAALLERRDGFHSAQDLHAQLRTSGNPVGLATVYRALQTLVEDGEVDVLRTGEDGEALYRRCSDGHHHHLVCRACGLTVEVEGSEVERWARSTAAEHGFSDVTHVLELFGTCAGCARSAEPQGTL